MNCGPFTGITDLLSQNPMASTIVWRCCSDVKPPCVNDDGSAGATQHVHHPLPTQDSLVGHGVDPSSDRLRHPLSNAADKYAGGWHCFIVAGIGGDDQHVVSDGHVGRGNCIDGRRSYTGCGVSIGIEVSTSTANLWKRTHPSTSSQRSTDGFWSNHWKASEIHASVTPYCTNLVSERSTTHALTSSSSLSFSCLKLRCRQGLTAGASCE